MNRAANTASAPVWGGNTNVPLPKNTTTNQQRVRPRTRTITTAAVAPLTVSSKHKIVSPSSQPSSPGTTAKTTGWTTTTPTPVSPLPTLTSFAVQNKVVSQPPLSQQQKRARIKTSATICAQTGSNNSNGPKTSANLSSSLISSSPLKSSSCSFLPSRVPFASSFSATAAAVAAEASTPFTGLRLRVQRQQQQQQQQRRTSPLPRVLRQQLQQQPRPSVRAMTWLDSHVNIPLSTAMKDGNNCAGDSRNAALSPSLPSSPLSPSPRTIADEQINAKDEQGLLDLQDLITGGSNEFEGDDHNGLDEYDDDRYSDDEHDVEEDLKSFLILNGTGNGGAVEVMSWLQEAIRTVNILESRVQELEQDCSSIPLYEQDRTQMSEVIQGLDEMVVQDRQWIEHTESAVQWATHVLEEALLGSFPPPSLTERAANAETAVTSQTTSTWFSLSEGMLPGLTTTAERSTGVGKVMTAGNPREVLEASERRMAKHRGTLYDKETLAIATSSSIASSDTALYRNSIQAALRHLRTIEHSTSLSSCSGSIIITGGESGENKGDSSTKKKKAPAPDRAMKNWLENASSTSLMSNTAAMTVDEEGSLELDHVDDDDDDVQELDERRDSINKAACSPFMQTQSTAPSSSSSSSSSCPQEHQSQVHHQQHESQQVAPSLNLLSLSAVSLQATLSGSSQSILPNTDLGDPCLVDERIYLKQHVQSLDHLRVQELERHRSIESGYSQLVQDLARFSSEMLQAVNTLTVAQAALDGANELSLMTLRMVEKEDEEMVGRSQKDYISATEGLKKSQRLLLQTPFHRQKRVNMIQNSCQELTESVGLVELEIRKMRRLAADCVGITELAHERLDDDNTSFSASSSVIHSSTTGAAASIKTLTRSTTHTPQLLQLQPGRSSLSVTNAAAYVDGLAFQEFEAHLATIRHNRESNNNSNNHVMTPFMKRVLAEDIQPCLLLNAVGGTANPRRNDSPQNINGGSRWMTSLLGSNYQNAYISSQTPVAWFPRLLGAMEKNACEIELQKSDDSSKSSPIGGECCCLCRVTRLCDFRLRLLEDESTLSAVSSSSTQIDSRSTKPSSIANSNSKSSSGNNYHHPLDRFCRDRVVAVCDFYMFLAHLRQGLLDHQPSLELFRRALLLRYRMGQARIGSVDITVNANTTTSSSIASH